MSAERDRGVSDVVRKKNSSLAELITERKRKRRKTRDIQRERERNKIR